MSQCILSNFISHQYNTDIMWFLVWVGKRGSFRNSGIFFMQKDFFEGDKMLVAVVSGYEAGHFTLKLLLSLIRVALLQGVFQESFLMIVRCSHIIVKVNLETKKVFESLPKNLDSIIQISLYVSPFQIRFKNSSLNFSFPCSC